MNDSSQPTTGLDSDSFLDIVANIVGILIILVMVVGLRIQYAPAPEAQLPQGLQEQVHNLHRQVESVRQQLQAAQNQAAQLETQKQSLKEQLDQLALRHQQLQAQAQQAQQRRSQSEALEKELQEQVLAYESQLRQLQLQLAQRSIKRPKTIHVVSYPTPVSRTVEEQEVHFQLTGGHLAYVPFEELVERLKEDARRRAGSLRHAAVISASVGPIRGYQLRYVLQKVSTISRLGTFSYARLVVATFVPQHDPPGVPLEKALEPNSEFRALLARLDPEQTVITVWVHPDSFSHFRRLKRELYELGFAVAARPLPQGRYISASPSGTRSQAQ